MSATKSTNPARDVALLALSAPEAYAGDMLVSVLEYAFEQLCWRRTANELDALLDGLRATIAEDE